MQKDLVLIGSGGFGREVAWLVERINEISPTWHILGFVDDDYTKHAQDVFGFPVLGDVDWLNQQPEKLHVVCCIGNPKIRQSIISKVQGHSFATLIDPSVLISKSVSIGEGSIICAGSIITVDISLGTHSIVNLDCTIGHDAIIDNFVTIYPSVNVSGNVVLESFVEIGTGTQIIQGVKIESGTIVGAGSIVVKDLPSNCTAVGSPAKPIKYHNS